jgi:hypothetical protein
VVSFSKSIDTGNESCALASDGTNSSAARAIKLINFLMIRVLINKLFDIFYGFNILYENGTKVRRKIDMAKKLDGKEKN